MRFILGADKQAKSLPPKLKKDPLIHLCLKTEPARLYAGKTWLIVLCLIFLTIALAGLTTMLLKTVLGKPKEGIEVGELNKSSVVVLATYLLLLLFMGIYISEPILQLLTNAVGIVLGQPNVSFGDMLVLPWQNLAQ